MQRLEPHEVPAIEKIMLKIIDPDMMDCEQALLRNFLRCYRPEKHELG